MVTSNIILNTSKAYALNGFTRAFIPIEDWINVVIAMWVRSIESNNVDDIEGHVNNSKEKWTPYMVHSARTTANPRVNDSCHWLTVKKIIICE